MYSLVKFTAWHIESKNRDINGQVKLSETHKSIICNDSNFIIKLAVMPKGKYFCILKNEQAVIHKNSAAGPGNAGSRIITPVGHIDARRDFLCPFGILD